MNNRLTDRFWTGGKWAWWRGLLDALKEARQRRATAGSDDERREAEAALKRLQEQATDASRNGHRRLF